MSEPSQTPSPADQRTVPAQPVLAPRDEDRPLLAFLPMIYVAWADGELTPGEIDAISRLARDRGGLEEPAQERLACWLDPDNPPPPRQLQAMVRLIRRAAADMDESRRAGLARLGMVLARQGGESPGAAVEEAVEELEAALGVVGPEASAEILTADRPRPKRPVSEPEPPFPVAELTALLDRPHGEDREAVRALLAEADFAPLLPPVTTEEYRDRVLEWLQGLAERGLGALSFPPETGGGGDLGRFIAAFETLGHGDLSLVVKYGVQFGLFGGSILQLGTEHHHERYLGDVGSGKLLGCFAMSETGHGSNVRDIETTARYDADSGELVVNTPHELARKDWIGNAARDGRMATVFAQLLVPVPEETALDDAGTGGDEEADGDAAEEAWIPEGYENHGVHAVLVPIRGDDGEALPGIGIEDCGHKEGLNGVDNGRLTFDQVRVPRENLLDRFGGINGDGLYESPIPGSAKRFFTMLGTLVGGRISVAAAAVSAAKSGLAVAVRYGAHRRQFGPAGEAEVQILDYQAHQRRLLPRLAAVYAHHFAVRWMAERFVQRGEEDSREVETLAAGIKALATWQTVDTLQTCREACGGQGYLSVNRFGRLKNDTDIFTTFEGDNTVLLQLVARGRLTEYKQQFGDARVFNLLNMVLQRAATNLTEKNPVITRRTGSEHLRDPDFLHAAFEYREETLLIGVARRLKRRLDSGMDSFQAFNECQDHLLALSRGFVERVVLERFRAAVAELPDGTDPDLAEALGKLLALWGLWRLEADVGWFMENHYVEPPKAAAIRDEVLALCAELRPLAVPLVDGFGVPRQWLAPIAFGAGTGTGRVEEMDEGVEEEEDGGS